MVMSNESNKNPAAATPMMNFSLPFSGVLSIARPMISGVRGADWDIIVGSPWSGDTLAEHEIRAVMLEAPHTQNPGSLVRRHPAWCRVNVGIFDMIQSDVTRISLNGAETARGDHAGETIEMRDMFGVVPVVELVLAVGIDVHRDQDHAAGILWGAEIAWVDLFRLPFPQRLSFRR